MMGYIAVNAAFLAQEGQRKFPDLVRKDGGDGNHPLAIQAIKEKIAKCR